ncbi:MAG: hypothetical protein IJA68_01200 [Clostridia bacterium]|nr:hypothetical protein [Clostridia bacterium]
MDKDKLWARFEQTGKVSDYLKYCGVDVFSSETNAVQGSEEPNETDDRRTDHSGKQQYR